MDGGQMNDQMDGRMGGGGQMLDGQMFGWTEDAWTDGWTDSWMDGWTDAWGGRLLGWTDDRMGR